MSTDYKEVMSKRTDEELIQIVTLDKDGYQPLAVIDAEEEIRNRNMDAITIERVKNELIKKNEADKQLEELDTKKSGFWSGLFDFLLYIFFEIFWFIFLPLMLLVILIIKLKQKEDFKEPVILNKMKTRRNKYKNKK